MAHEVGRQEIQTSSIYKVLMTTRQKPFKTAQQIMDAVDHGEAVFWNSLRYPVHRDRLGQYFIGEGPGMVGLTWADGVTLNGKLDEFFVLTKGEHLRLFPPTQH